MRVVGLGVFSVWVLAGADGSGPVVWMELVVGWRVLGEGVRDGCGEAGPGIGGVGFGGWRGLGRRRWGRGGSRWAGGSRRCIHTRAGCVRQGWLESCSRLRGEGSLVWASRAGVQHLNRPKSAGMPAGRKVPAAIGKAPLPVTWPHWEACAWTAAWLTARGRGMIGPREMQLGTGLCGELRWRERGESRSRGHRPDLAARLADGSCCRSRSS